TKRPIFQAGDNAGVNVRFFGSGKCPEGEASSRRTPAHKIAGIYGDFAAVADDDDSAVGSEQLYVVRKIHVGEHFQDDVHAAAPSSFHDFIEIAGFAVIENLMSPFACDEIKSLLAACGAENGQSQTAC